MNIRLTKECNGKRFAYPIAEGADLCDGGLVALDATGAAVPAGSAAAVTIVGIVDALNGVTVTARRGCFAFDVDTANPPTVADVNKPVYAVDPATVSISAGEGRPQAGFLRGVSLVDGCWVEIQGTNPEAE